MKFTKEKYQVISDIEQRLGLSFHASVIDFVLDAGNEVNGFLKDHLDIMQGRFISGAHDVFYLSSGVGEMINKGISAGIFNRAYEMIDRLKGQCGALLLPPSCPLAGAKYITYNVSRATDGGNVISFGLGGQLGILLFGGCSHDTSKTGWLKCLASDPFKINSLATQEDGILQISSFVVAFLLFKDFTDVETKVITPRAKSPAFGERHKNESNVKVCVIGSDWFVTTIRSEGFSVKGHFASRACGPGWSDRRLVWISGYQKKGHTKKAKILTHGK